VALRSICVFCGARPGRRPEYASEAQALGRLIAARGLSLVYGGGRVGLMGLIADAALAQNGAVVGVIPDALATSELAHNGLTELHVVPSMHARKALMAERADAFVAMPGGVGTLEELFEILTWAQLGLHAKPVGLLNVGGFFDALLGLLDHTVSEGFVLPEDRERIVQAPTASALLERLMHHHPEQAPQRVRPEET
jgi:uncharacterized protein (TIGR00730 family)